MMFDCTQCKTLGEVGKLLDADPEYSTWPYKKPSYLLFSRELSEALIELFSERYRVDAPKLSDIGFRNIPVRCQDAPG
jgi:hypothetical protein